MTEPTRPAANVEAEPVAGVLRDSIMIELAFCQHAEKTISETADRLSAVIASALEQVQKDALEDQWFDRAIREHCDEHGPSGGAWNISMVLERLHRAHKAKLQDQANG